MHEYVDRERDLGGIGSAVPQDDDSFKVSE